MGDQVEEHGSTRRIAVAVDRSEESLDALKWALEKVCRSSDKLVVLHVTSSFEGQPLLPRPHNASFCSAASFVLV